MVLSRAPREMKMSKGVVSFCHKCNVSKILLSFEKVSFGKFRAILKNALFRETAPIAPIFFGGSGGEGGGGVTRPGPTRELTRHCGPLYFFYFFYFYYYYYYYYYFFFNAAEFNVQKQSASYAAVTTHY